MLSVLLSAKIPRSGTIPSEEGSLPDEIEHAPHDDEKFRALCLSVFCQKGVGKYNYSIAIKAV